MGLGYPLLLFHGNIGYTKVLQLQNMPKFLILLGNLTMFYSCRGLVK